MAERKSISLDRRRRSSRGLSSARDILVGIPSDIPQHGRLLILLRKCCSASVKKLEREEDISPELVKALCIECDKIFEDDGPISGLTKLVTDPANQVKGEDDVLNYNESFRKLVEESEKWDELESNGIAQDNPKEIQWEPSTYDYQALLDKSTDCKRQAQLCLAKVTKLSEELSAYVTSRAESCKVSDIASFVEDDVVELFQQLLTNK